MYDAEVLARMLSAAIYQPYMLFALGLFHWIARTKMHISICLHPEFFVPWIMKKIESEELSTRVVTYYNNEVGRITKLTVTHFKKRRSPNEPYTTSSPSTSTTTRLNSDQKVGVLEKFLINKFNL